MQKQKVKKHLHRGSLHLSAVALAALGFLAANEHMFEAYSHGHKKTPVIASMAAERELPHQVLMLGSPKLATVSGGV
ncbi:MAG: hypothetical protein JWM37_626 [Candidatus Saccharibacteria bacterium]|nr:hypothetical protein [Candidatus Saccharibacteria bacterium]